MSTPVLDQANLPKPPTEAEMIALLRQRSPGLNLYNPSDIWVRAQVHGIEHFFPPDLGGSVEPHPVTQMPTVCDGLYTVQGRWFSQTDSSGKQITGQDAQSIVAFILRREGYGQMGIVWLPGRSEEEDLALKGLARDRWLEYQQNRDDEIIAKRREFKANWERNPSKQGVPCPAPTRSENAAMERLQEREAKKEYGYECHVPECPGYATDEWEKYAKHMASAHKIRALRTPGGDITLTNAAGDTQVISAALGGKDGQPVEVTEESPGAEAEEQEAKASLEAAAEALAPRSPAQVKKARKPRRKRG